MGDPCSHVSSGKRPEHHGIIFNDLPRSQRLIQILPEELCSFFGISFHAQDRQGPFDHKLASVTYAKAERVIPPVKIFQSTRAFSIIFINLRQLWLNQVQSELEKPPTNYDQVYIFEVFTAR
jgi:hypothetical protein